MEVMSKKATPVSDFGIRVSAAIRAEAGMRRVSGRQLAAIMGKSPAYVNERIHDNKEWTLGDLGSLCAAWGMTPEQLLSKYRS